MKSPYEDIIREFSKFDYDLKIKRKIPKFGEYGIDWKKEELAARSEYLADVYYAKKVISQL